MLFIFIYHFQVDSETFISLLYQLEAWTFPPNKFICNHYDFSKQNSNQNAILVARVASALI